MGTNRSGRTTIAVTAAVCLLLGVPSSPAGADHATTTRVSVGADGGDPDGYSSRAMMSGNGTHIVFDSTANNLVVPDNHRNLADVFWVDLATGETRMVSTDHGGDNDPNGTSTFPAVSCDGRYVAFMSTANNLVPDDHPDSSNDIFRRDMQTGVTVKMTVGFDGSPPNGGSARTSMSCDGNLVAYNSRASNLVPGDDNGRIDLFVTDMTTGETTRLAESNDGDSARPILSGDGRYVAFTSDAGLLPADTNGKADIYRIELATAELDLVSVNHRGGNLNRPSRRPHISHDGRYVMFQTGAPNVVQDDTNGVEDVFMRDMVSGTTTRISFRHDGTPTTGQCTRGVVSDDARYVAAACADTRIVPDDTNQDYDAFLWDRVAGTVELLGVSSADVQGDCPPPDGGEVTTRPTLSRDGRVIGIVSSHCNLVPNDNNDVLDIFVRDFT
ncbi:MAG: TolB family protein [Acidimicrobiales bacterium]